MNLLKSLLLLTAFSLTPFAAHAAPCTTDSFAIKTMQNAITGDDVALPGPVDATSCEGLFEGNNDQGGLSSPDPNLG